MYYFSTTSDVLLARDHVLITFLFFLRKSWCPGKSSSLGAIIFTLESHIGLILPGEEEAVAITTEEQQSRKQ